MSEEKWDTEANQIRKAIDEATPERLSFAHHFLGLTKPVDNATAETATLVICSTDNHHIIGQQEVPCVDCGRTVYISPSSPKKPPKICFKCFTVRLEKEDQ